MRILLILLLGVCLMNSAYSAQTNTQASIENEANKKIKIFATELKSTLVAAIQTDGLQNAVQVCSHQAAKIAENLSTDGWTVARTSLKARNEDNKPDEWETQVLLSFVEQHKSGEKPSTLLISQLKADEFRLMKAIPTSQVCLACHGSAVDPALLQSINALYPNDIAVGYSLGDIRGAFTVTKIINQAP